ncbi:transglutaminase domain-containing protein [Burkholderia ubonensis]|uniref:transglutaminase domain-containing protein n=1 Tax=Burkholderia ubonensis TaxID=101571 RepID=UPI000ABE23F6|nr:transglutaminase domain-containing protein [Burkholderia ubonensis]
MRNTTDLTQELLGLITAIPASVRRFDTDADTAARHYGTPPAMLDDLTRRGLPCAGAEGARRYDPFDLSNLALHLGLPSIQRLAMRTWARALQLAASHRIDAATVKVLPIGADSATADPLEVLHVPIAEHARYAEGPVKALLDAWAGYRFFMLPEACRWDVGFIEQHRVCECGGASKRMLQQAHEQGLDARQCFGLLLATPFSTGHYWTEFRIDGEWVAFDPLLLDMLHAACRLDLAAWPAHRSNGAVLHRLCVIDRYDAHGAPVLDRYVDEPYVSQPLVIMDGQALAVSLPTAFGTPRPAGDEAPSPLHAPAGAPSIGA